SRASGRVMHDASGGLHPADTRHTQIHEHDIGVDLPQQFERLLAGFRRARHLEVRLGVEQADEARAHDRVIVHAKDPDHRSLLPAGRRTSSRAPPDPPRPKSTVPPTARTRSASPLRPKPAGPSARIRGPMPSSSTVSSAPPSESGTSETRTVSARACLRAFASP